MTEDPITNSAPNEIEKSIKICEKLIRQIPHEEFAEFEFCRHQMLFRLFRNLQSIKSILRGFIVSDLSPHVTDCDITSLYLVARSILESHIQFYYMYVESENDEEKQFRFLCWKREGLMTRQKFHSGSRQIEQKKENERLEIDLLYERIKSSTVYEGFISGLKENGRDNFRKNGKWMPFWKTIMTTMGVSDAKKSTLYSLMSSHVHGEYLSYLQQSEMMRAGTTFDFAQDFCKICLPIINTYILQIAETFRPSAKLSEQECIELIMWENVYTNSRPG